MLDPHLIVKTRPQADPANLVVRGCFRVTVLSDRLFRLEEDVHGHFCDEATQAVWYRDLPRVNYTVEDTKDGFSVSTAAATLLVGRDIAHSAVILDGKRIKLDNRGNLLGTYRTLDRCNGNLFCATNGEQHPIELSSGVVSRTGVAVYEDKDSLILGQDGMPQERAPEAHDLYIFAFGHDYRAAVSALYSICGETPLIPRYALGNWWSRYHAYTDREYLHLMDNLADRDLPFTVATVDMDWHWSTTLDAKKGITASGKNDDFHGGNNGWTGYSWNTDLFPDHKRFLRALRDRGYHVTLNLHPADGVRYFEDMYPEMAKAMGVDPATEEKIPFRMDDPAFINAYFRILHQPYEREGVDFWWIDWQQGTNCKVEGLDPLWIFNHFHFLDSKRKGQRPMTFSRYAGPGSHRYPIGFSGDTVTTWESLDFQPYFTETASNIGYGWWSHDIGGHMMGYKNDEMVARWTQLGAFSPIMRLHSSSSEFNGKEPWRFKKEAEMAMGDALRLRHAMMPYLYTMNHRSYQEDLPLVLPMYYDYPEEAQAYLMKNQYFFGSEMMVAPITQPRVKDLNVAKVKVWFPDGLWYDMFTGMMYRGGRTLDVYRSLESIPVFAKAGGIVPFTEDIKGTDVVKNPEHLKICVYAGADGRFVMYEDDNETCAYEHGACVTTEMIYTEEKTCTFTICPAQGSLELIPAKRSYTLELTGFDREAVKHTEVLANDTAKEIESITYDEAKQAVVVKLPMTSVAQKITVTIPASFAYVKNQVEERCFDFLNQAEISFVLKDRIYSLIQKQKDAAILVAELAAMDLDPDLYGALAEIITA